MRNIVPIVTTGNLQVVVYDLTRNFMYISYARRDGITSGAINAYDRPYIKVNTTALWTEQRPTEVEIEESKQKTMLKLR